MTMTAAAVARLLGSAPEEDLPGLVRRFELDDRATVRAAVARARRRLEALARERERVRALYDAAWELGAGGLVIGADEVGRGPVAGPLTVAAVALPWEPAILGLDDSKRVPAAKRAALAQEVRDRAVAVSVACVDAAAIDRDGMAASLRVCFSRAIQGTGLADSAAAVVVDGLPLGVHPREVAVVKGDARVAPVAAASLVAKVFRDSLMERLDLVFPGYGLASNKGYGSAAHIEAIRSLGLSPIHRRSFCGKFLDPIGLC